MQRRTVGIAVLVSLGCAATVVAVGRIAHTADHMDSPSTKADPTADINDLYGWMDGTNAVFALTVFPAAMAASDAGPGSQFSNTVQYVIHTESGASFGQTTASENIICTFSVSQNISCWAGTDEYVTGNASNPAGLSSADGKFKVFAGLRADPFFFNLDGFHQTEADVEAAEGTLTFDQAGCPQLDPVTAATLRTQLQTAPDGGPAADFFAPLNGLAIVVSIDKSLVTKGGPILAAWASTHTAS
jgi:hypothetical protein